MQVELARRHHQHQQRSNYMNIPFSVPQSTASNYHLVSDPNGNAMGAESTDIHGSDSTSSSAASSFVHLPLAGVDNSATSMLVKQGYDNVSYFFLIFSREYLGPLFPLGSAVVIYGCAAFCFISAVDITVGYSPPEMSFSLLLMTLCSRRMVSRFLIEGLRPRRRRQLRHPIIATLIIIIISRSNLNSLNFLIVLHTTKMPFHLTNVTNINNILISHNNNSSQT